jgi:LPS O-antigen subunit length determinant protein (WzzB/FepE family)
VLIDTPGFSDTNHSDTEILRRIAEWMKDTYDEGFLLSGIIYLHRIIDVRMEGPSLKNLRMMQQLCGSDSLRNVVLATTMWEKVTNEEGSRREAELEQTFWKSMIDGGATISKIKTQSATEAQSLIRSMMKNTPRSTRLQEELSSGLTLVQTAAGIEIKEEIAKLEQNLRAEHDAEMQELRAAQANRKKPIFSNMSQDFDLF